MAKTLIKSEEELNTLLYEAMYNAVEYTMVKLFQENEDLIEKYVYDAYPGEHYYDRTKQFLDAWNYKLKKTSSHHMLPYTSSRVFGEFYYDPSVMDYVPEKAQHGTPTGQAMDGVWGDTNMWAWRTVESAWGDARDYLADILYQGKSGPLFGDGPWRKKRDAWTPLINKLDRGKIFTWFEQGMNNQHLKVYKR